VSGVDERDRSVLTVTVPSQEIAALIGEPPTGVRIRVWDLLGDLDDPASIDAVLVPDYFFDVDGFARLRALPNLRFVQMPSAGIDHAQALLPTGVPVANGRGVHDAETAEHAVGLMLAALRGVADAVRDARWNPATRSSLVDRRVLLVGYGQIGQAIARRLEPFEVGLTVVARTARDQDGRRVHAFTELPQLLPDAEVVVLIAPATEETRGLVDAAFLASMPDGALLVNVARGTLVDTTALVAELETGRLHAALDVTDPEPLPDDHALWRTPNTIITPHLAGRTTATAPRIAALMRRQLAALADGREPEAVVLR
jgi:phosphoglycerate dehydrogenase-like enzyme